MDKTEQQFLQELESTLWKSADKLRTTLDAAQYKHVVLGLIFVKYISDAFAARQKALLTQFQNPEHDNYLAQEDGVSDHAYQAELQKELEIRDFYTECNVFWVPKVSRWQFLQNHANLAVGGFHLIQHADGRLEVDTHLTSAYKTEVEQAGAKVVRISSVGHLIDHALTGIETENPKLKGILNKLYSSLQIDQAKLKELIELFANTQFAHATLQSKDILGHVYEYMLGQFALAEGKKGGQYYTPASIVRLIVEMIEPFQGRVYDPAMGSGGFFVQSENFIEQHATQQNLDPLQQKKAISIYGQEYNHTTWQLAAMNMAIRGLDYNFGQAPGCTFKHNQHVDLRADFIMANPPFNIKDWHEPINAGDNAGQQAKAAFEGDPRWRYGLPPLGNANFAWLQHMLHHLSADGSLALLLANGSMSSMTNNEGAIRQRLVEADLIECMVALPSQLFANTQIPACIWFLTKNKTQRTDSAGRALRHRQGETLFIDLREMGYMKDRVLRDFSGQDIHKVADLYHAWKTGQAIERPSDAGVQTTEYQDQPGFCKSVTLDEIQKHDFVLTPGRYVGAAPEQDDGVPFAEKMQSLTQTLSQQLQASSELEAQIKASLKGLGYEL
jgi:type I restriction enzyme M protein